MIIRRQMLTILCLGACLSAAAVHAADTTPPPPPPPGHHWHGHPGGGPLGAYGFLLHKLDLTAEQKASVKTILAGEKSQFETLHTSVKANMKALATTPPTSTAYTALVTTAQENAATRISLETTIWTDIYKNVLTDTQREAIPNIVATAETNREEKASAWHAAHPQT
jgi:Spy/CpxP family protein refolding chaperone